MKLVGWRMMESQETEDLDLRYLSVLRIWLVRPLCHPKGLLKESVPRWSSRYAWSGEAGQGELWPCSRPWQLEEWNRRVNFSASINHHHPQKTAIQQQKIPGYWRDVSSLKYRVENISYIHSTLQLCRTLVPVGFSASGFSISLSA